ncbi:MAG: hypothetical protein PWQ87_477 [Candidatus Woesearchaeota archaeon]|nr:hypothetical protein [Candidatus Woesearchaeota archaeon]
MNKKAQSFFNAFLVLSLAVSLSLLLSYDIAKRYDTSRIKTIEDSVVSISNALSNGYSNNYFLRESLSKAYYSSLFNLASNGSIKGYGDYGMLRGANVVLWHEMIPDEETIENNLSEMIDDEIVRFLNQSNYFLTKEEKFKYEIDDSNENLFLSVKGGEQNTIIPNLSVELPLKKDDAIEVEPLYNLEGYDVEAEYNLISPVPEQIGCGFSEDCSYIVSEEDAEKIRQFYWLYLTHGLIFERKFIEENGKEYLCFNKTPINSGLFAGSNDNRILTTTAEIYNFLSRMECSDDFKEKELCCLELKKEGIQGDFYDSQYFKGSIVMPFNAYKSFEYNYLNRSKEFLWIIETLEECMSGSIEYGNDDLEGCIEENKEDFESKEFVVKEYKGGETTDERKLYNLSESYSMILESEDLECISKPVNPFVPASAYINSTHFFLYNDEMSSAMKLNGFSSDSPIDESQVCVVDLLGMPIDSISIKEDISLAEILSIANEDDVVWHKDENGNVCIGIKRFSPVSLSRLTYFYFKDFYEEELGIAIDELVPVFGEIVDIVSIINKVMNELDEEDDEGFCELLESKNFVNIEDVFPECYGSEERHFFNFYDTLDKLEKNECSAVRRWFAVEAVDTSLLYPVETDEGLAISNPVYIGAFFVD